ncbi:MAG TPA: hypothetical protein VFG23_19680, partial [Polyangia bacterium]|nr:hypothetical protein [Polyangia bacterium]
PWLVVGGATVDGAAPSVGVTAVGRTPFAAAFDAGGHLGWTRSTPSRPSLQTDADGNLFALSVSYGTLLVDRWDAAGMDLANTNFSPEPSTTGVLGLVSVSVAGGIVVAGDLSVQNAQDIYCVQKQLLFRIDTADLAIDPLTLKLP